MYKLFKARLRVRFSVCVFWRLLPVGLRPARRLCCKVVVQIVKALRVPADRVAVGREGEDGFATERKSSVEQVRPPQVLPHP